MESREHSESPDEHGDTRAPHDDETVTWNHDVRMGWLASDDPLSDAWFYAVRNCDGKTVSARDRRGLIAAMAAADVSRTLTDALASEPDPELPEELR